MNTVLEYGKSAHLSFQKECETDPGRLQKTIKRRPVVDFAKANQMTAGKKPKVPTNAESMRDSFVKMLILVVDEAQLDMDLI